MTKEETVEIMAILGAVYADGKNDPQTQAVVWHELLQGYEYDTVRKAVFSFIRNDLRDNATFPTAGKILKAIEAEISNKNKPIAEVVGAIANGWNYKSLSKEAKTFLDEKQYEAWVESYTKADKERLETRLGAMKANAEVKK